MHITRNSSDKLGLSKLIALIKWNFMLLCFLRITPRANCCDNRSLGSSACIRISRYNGEAQWSTCVTDLYIKQKSKGRHGCAKGQRICIYQCMLEVHGADSGTVSSPCVCSEGKEPQMDDGKASITSKPNITLPSTCFSPSGADCRWFKTCLSRKFSCGKRFKSEVIHFAEELCELYLNAYSDLSNNGSVWVNGVRKCLQVSLVPMLRRWHGANSAKKHDCNSLTKQAISSYTHCFYSPFPAYIPTICELPLEDLWRVFWHLRQTLGENVQHSLLTILRNIENCKEFQKSKLNLGIVRKFVFRLQRSEKLDVSSFNDKATERKLLNEELGKKIAKQFCLDKEGIAWFAFPKSIQEFTNNTAEVVFYIADKHEHKMSRRLQLDTTVNLNRTVLTLVEAVRRNELCFQVFGGKQDYRISETTVCRDLECRSNSWKVIAGSASNDSSVLKCVSGFFILVQFILYVVFPAL